MWRYCCSKIEKIPGKFEEQNNAIRKIARKKWRTKKKQTAQSSLSESTRQNSARVRKTPSVLTRQTKAMGRGYIVSFGQACGSMSTPVICIRGVRVDDCYACTHSTFRQQEHIILRSPPPPPLPFPPPLSNREPFAVGHNQTTLHREKASQPITAV